MNFKTVIIKIINVTIHINSLINNNAKNLQIVNALKLIFHIFLHFYICK